MGLEVLEKREEGRSRDKERKTVGEAVEDGAEPCGLE